MTSAENLMDNMAVRCMIVGYPGSAKTGALCSLLNVGYKVRVIDFDGNYEPLILYTKPEFRKNLDVVTLEDALRPGQKTIEVAGIPAAFNDGFKLLDRWKYTDTKTGEEVDMGLTKEWGPDTVVVLDSLTSMGVAAKRHAMAVLNRTPLNTTQQVWGVGMSDQEAFLEKMTSRRNRFHTVVIAHLKMVGPKDIEKDDSDLTKKLKEQMADLVRTRLFPSALGHALPQTVSAHFPTVLEARSVVRSGKPKRILITVPREELDLKVPALGLPDELDVSDGLLRVFQAITGKSGPDD